MIFILFLSVCGAHYSMESGTLVSPGYPNNYVNDLNCNYTITVDPQKFVILTFLPSYFGIEGLRNKPGPNSRINLPNGLLRNSPGWKEIINMHRNLNSNPWTPNSTRIVEAPSQPRFGKLVSRFIWHEHGKPRLVAISC